MNFFSWQFPSHDFFLGFFPTPPPPTITFLMVRPLLLRVLLLAFIVLLQNEHTSLVENSENLISAQPRISAHSQGPKI